ncbi:hypothetical protein D3C72_1936760 [compost metagenome]
MAIKGAIRFEGKAHALLQRHVAPHGGQAPQVCIAGRFGQGFYARGGAKAYRPIGIDAVNQGMHMPAAGLKQRCFHGVDHIAEGIAHL